MPSGLLGYQYQSPVLVLVVGRHEEGTGRRSRKGAIEVPELQDIVIQEEPSPAQRQKEKKVQVWSYPCGRAALQAQREVQGEGT